MHPINHRQLIRISIIVLGLGPNDPCWGRHGHVQGKKPGPGTVVVSGHGHGVMKPMGKRRKRVNQFRKIGINLQQTPKETHG